MANDMANLPVRPDEPSSEGRLDSWKEIAAYLKHSERTVRRWQEEGLPVHRHAHKKRAGVYAYKPELDAWWSDGHARLEELERVQAARGWPWRLWSAAAGLALLLAFSGVFLARSRIWPRTRPPAGKIMFAVLPFENLSGDSEQEYFSDGLTEEMISRLGQMEPQRLGVIARTSAIQYKGTKKRIDQIGKELGVDYVLEGTVRHAGDRVRVSAQLIQVKDQTHLGAKNYERNLRDILSLQDEVAQAIANEVMIKLTPQEQARLTSARPLNPEAHELYLKGRYYWNKRTAEALTKSFEYFQRTIEKDPSYGLAYAGLADAYLMLGAGEYAVLRPKEAFPKAEAAARRALELDSTLAEPHATLAYAKDVFHWDRQGAEREYKQAIELNPSYAEGHHWYGSYLAATGRYTEAIAEARKAESLDPLSLVISADVGMEALAPAGRYDEAMQQCRKTLELDPRFAIAHACLARAYEYKTMYKEAIAEIQEAINLSGGSVIWEATLGHLYARAGRRDDAIKILNELKSRSKREFVPSQAFIWIYAALGDKDQAFAWLEKAHEERSDVMTVLEEERAFDPLRSDPRFQDLLRRIGLPR
jgi:TolB-like protein/Flp pilus assembly protein TadD